MSKQFIQYFEDSFKENWDLPAMTNYETNQTFKFKDIAREIAMYHMLFKSLGISQDDKIGLLGVNTPEWAIVFISAVTYGAVAVPLLPNLSVNDQINIINHADCVILFSDDYFAPKLKGECMPNLRAIFSLVDKHCSYQKDGEAMVQIVRDLYSTFINKYPDGVTKSDVVYADKDDYKLAVLNYTSGTTGLVKAVMLCGENFKPQIEFAYKNRIGGKEDIYLSYLPLAHVGGYTGFFPQLLYGSHIYFLSKIPSPQAIIEICKELCPSYLVVVPLVLETMFRFHIKELSGQSNEQILNSQSQELRNKIVNLLGGKIRMLFIGGASLDSHIENALNYLKIPYMIGYGMTETAAIVSANVTGVKNSVGKSLDGVNISIDSEDSENIPGEILVKGRNVMLGYYKDEGATKAAFTEDGWLKTGDMGVLDKRGYLYVKGRCKTMILTSSGENIYPETIEMKINQSQYIKESVVVLDENRLVALIYPDYSNIEKDLSKESLEKIMDSVRKDINEELASHEYISEYIVCPEPFEKTPKNYIKRYLYEK